jgi:hypothetical protein
LGTPIMGLAVSTQHSGQKTINPSPFPPFLYQTFRNFCLSIPNNLCRICFTVPLTLTYLFRIFHSRFFPLHSFRAVFFPSIRLFSFIPYFFSLTFLKRDTEILQKRYIIHLIIYMHTWYTYPYNGHCFRSTGVPDTKQEWI